MDNRPIFSVIIVSWNTCALTLQAIRSVLAQGDPDVEVIVVDNASSDASVERIRAEFPSVRLIVNEENLGYARANNLAMKVARGDYFVLLNSDAELITLGIFGKLRQVFDAQPKVAAVGAKLVLPSGKIQAIGRKFLTVKILIKEQLLFAHAFCSHESSLPHVPIEVDYIPGAFLAVRRQVVESVGMLNEAFFIYGEDMEWCRRMKQAGWRLIALSELVVLHHHAASAKQTMRSVLVHNTVNNCRYFAKFESSAQAKTAYDLYLCGMALRIPLSMLRRNGLACDYLSGFVTTFKLRSRLKNLMKNYQSEIFIEK